MGFSGDHKKKKEKATTNTSNKTSGSNGLKKLLSLTLALILLPQIVAAQTVDVGGTVNSQVSASKSSVVADPSSIPANGVATSIVTVTLRNSSGATLPNIEVTLTSSRTSLDTIGHYVGTVLTPGNSHTSDANGVVKFGVRSSTVGSSTVTAIAESLVTLDDKPIITFTSTASTPPAIDPKLSTVVADPLSLLANNTDLTTITVTLRNVNGNPIVGRSVTLTSSRGILDSISYYSLGSLLTGNSFLTDASGVVKFAVSSASPGSSTFSVIAIETNGNSVPLSNSPVVSFTKVPVDEPPKEGAPPPSKSDPPTPPPITGTLERVVDFFQENAEETNNTLAGLGALTTLTLFPTITTSAITTILQNIPFLNFLLTSWLPIRRRKKWGTIRDKKTGVPIAGVEVQLFSEGNTDPTAKYRTDQTGQYGFLVGRAGNYSLKITNPLYQDYQSEIFRINAQSEAISIDIPLEPEGGEQAQQTSKARRYMDWVGYLNYLSVILVSAGTIVSIYVFYIEPNLVAGLILGLYVVIWGVKLYHYTNYRYYGLVVYTEDKSPIDSAVIQLTGKRQGVQALVHSTISDNKGRFLFIVKPSKYSMIAAKAGYAPAEAEVTEQRISKTIEMRRGTSLSAD